MLLGAGCATRHVPLTRIEVPFPTVPIHGLPLLGPGQDDLRFMRWERAFEKMHARIRAEYPYTQWKAVDWDALHAEFAPQVAAAQTARDADAWYAALSTYMLRIPDDKAGITPKGDQSKAEEDATEEGDFLGAILDEPLSSRMLPEKLGYIEIRFFAPSITTPFPGRAFSRALSTLLKAGAAGLILDLRGNPGGADDLAAEFAGHFTSWQDEAPPVFVKYAEYNRREDAFATKLIYPANPVDPLLSVPVAVLVDGRTSGVAELFTHFAQQHGAKVIAREATRGSVGVPGGSLSLPKGHVVSYPTGRALDGEGAILIERDATGAGGVHPDELVSPDEDDSRADAVLAQAIKILQ